MERKWEFRLSGTGGQGIIKAAVLLAQAALYDGFDATQSQVYGPESRGGSTKGEVVIDDQLVHYPKVTKPNVVLCMSKEAYKKYAGDVRDGGILIIDSHNCVADDKIPAGVKVYSLPIVLSARDVLKNELSANVIAFGVILGLTDVVSLESAEASLEANFKAKIVPMNVEALKYGYKMGKDALQS